ncbi:serine/threonine-protein kinase [Nocardia sp. NBC_01388]|uniref:serine/threonine-protein kinase n=1 Tax=Nocardia sp. NBC_01388 TaxID=2903596 RepID=UPI003243CA21
MAGVQLQQGSVFAGYTIERRLGAGGMGVVFLARHPRLDRSVALKVLAEAKAADRDIRHRFDREVAVVTHLDHPNIVPVYDRGVEDGVLWLSMKYVAGGDVANLLAREGVLAPGRAVALIADAAAGLDHAHRRGVVHRDVKPANLLLDSDGTAERAVVADFGIARTLDSTSTASGLMASFAYTAPERFAGDLADHRSDVYSLGCTLFELLTGRTPFPNTNQAAVMAAHLGSPPPRPSALRPGLGAGLDMVIATALAKHPQDRYTDCAALAESARRALTTTDRETPVPLPDSEPAHFPRWTPAPPAAVVEKPIVQERSSPDPPRRRYRILAAAAVMVVVAVSVSTLAIIWNDRHYVGAATLSTSPPAASTAVRAGVPTTVTPSTTLPAPVIAPPSVIARCNATPEIRPVRLSSLHCGTNADIWIDNLTWTRWDENTAVASGTEHFNTCEPSCSAGNERLDAVTVTLDNVAPFDNVYTRITLAGDYPETDTLPTA